MVREKEGAADGGFSAQFAEEATAEKKLNAKSVAGLRMLVG